MVSYERILVAVDGSDGSERASRHALAAATGASIDFLAVVETGGLGALGDLLDADAARDRGRTVLSAAAELAEEAGVDATTELREGRPDEEILAAAAERGSDLVVMGRRGAGAGAGGGRLLGGVTDRVLRAGECPVLAVPGSDRAGRVDPAAVDYGRILLPTDGSDPAVAAAPHGVAIARGFESSVHVVSVVDVSAAGGFFDAGGVSDEFVERLESEGEAAVSEMVERVRAAGAPSVERAVVRGRPHEALGEYVETRDVDLVVMGAHGRSGVRRWVLGSVTDRVLRTADVPVLVVPGAEAGESGK